MKKKEPIAFRDDITIKIDTGGVSFTLGARNFKGVQCVMQRVTGSLAPGAHPGGFNGQDAYNDILVTENEDLHDTQTVLPHGSTGGIRCGTDSNGQQRTAKIRRQCSKSARGGQHL